MLKATALRSGKLVFQKKYTSRETTNRGTDDDLDYNMFVGCTTLCLASLRRTFAAHSVNVCACVCVFFFLTFLSFLLILCIGLFHWLHIVDMYINILFHSLFFNIHTILNEKNKNNERKEITCSTYAK